MLIATSDYIDDKAGALGIHQQGIMVRTRLRVHTGYRACDIRKDKAIAQDILIRHILAGSMFSIRRKTVYICL